MGEGTIDVVGDSPPDRLEHEVEAIRGSLTQIAGELDRRRRALTAWRQELGALARPAAITGAVVVLLAAGFVAFEVWRRRSAVRTMGVLRRWQRALARVASHPELVARPQPSVARNVATAAASSFVGAASKSLAQRLVSASSPPPG